jgi:hypothetical protein
MYTGPNIIRDGLIFHVDAANSRSANGDTWSDLSASANDETYVNDNGLIEYVSDGPASHYYRNVKQTNSDKYRSNDQVYLDDDFTMIAWVMPLELHASTANGILTQHLYSNFKGAGITIRYISATDFRMSCNTGNGTTRTYQSYYGTTNIKDKWSYLVLRFIKSTNNLSLWVNGVNEKEITYAQLNELNYIDLFNWSTNQITSSYKPKCRIAMASVYNTALTDDGIIQNFNATKTRFY